MTLSMAMQRSTMPEVEASAMGPQSAPAGFRAYSKSRTEAPDGRATDARTAAAAAAAPPTLRVDDSMRERRAPASQQQQQQSAAATARDTSVSAGGRRPSTTTIGLSPPAAEGATPSGRRASSVGTLGRMPPETARAASGSPAVGPESLKAPSPKVTPGAAAKGTRPSTMEPTRWKKWTALVDRQTLGAHYDYIVGDLSAVFTEPNVEQQRYDEVLTAGLHNTHPEDCARRHPAEEGLAAASAFTDRALRLREGKGARAALFVDPQPAPAASHDQGSCTCSVCCPQSSMPAGQPSHLVHYNRVPRCGRDSHDAVPTRTVGGKTSSDQVAKSMTLPDSLGDTDAPLGEEHERTFHRGMGRKVRTDLMTTPGGGRVMPHRSLSVDCVRTAGDHNQELTSEISCQRGLRRQAWQDHVGVGPGTPRHGVALVLGMRRDGDPPAPTSICSSHRAPGVFRHGASAESETFARYYNEPLLRFADPASVRGRSGPCTTSSATGCAGVPSGDSGSHMWSRSSPVAMDDCKDTTCRSALSTTSGSRTFRSFRSNPGNTSRLVSHMLNHEECSEHFAMHAEYRKQTEPEFAALCAATQDHKRGLTVLVDAIKQRNAPSVHDSELKRSLMWQQE